MNYNTRLNKRKNGGIIRWWSPDGKFHQASTFFGVTCMNSGYWWTGERWAKLNEADKSHDGWGTHTKPGVVKTVKAFRRRLRQWSKYLPPGVEFMLCSRFDELSVTGYTR